MDDIGHPRERRTKKRTGRMVTGETFTLRSKMKIVLLDALMRGQRAWHYIRVSEASCQRYEDRGQLSLSR